MNSQQPSKDEAGSLRRPSSAAGSERRRFWERPSAVWEDTPEVNRKGRVRHMTIIISKTKLALGVLAMVLIGATVVAAGDGPFTDNPDGTYYHDPVEWAYDNGVTTGTSATTFSPMDPVTRGQNVTFAYRYDQNIVQPAFDTIDDNFAIVEDALDEIEDNVATVASDVNNSTRVHFARVVADGTIEKASSDEITVDYDDASLPGQFTVTLPEAAANCAVQSTLGWTADTNDGLAALGNAIANAAMMSAGTHTFHIEDQEPNEVIVYTYLDDVTNTDPAELTGLSFMITASCSDPEFNLILPGIPLIPIIIP